MKLKEQYSKLPVIIYLRKVRYDTNTKKNPMSPNYSQIVLAQYSGYPEDIS